jgi:hypothetical protein
MKPLIRTLLALALLTSARADLTITQELKQDAPGGAKGMDTTLTMKVKGEKVRMDGIPQMSNIVDLKSGDVTSLMHAQKAVMTIPGATVKQLADSKAQQNPKLEPPKATGKKESIGGFACEEYETSLNGAKIHLWLTKDVPKVEEAMKKISELSASADPFQSMLKDQNISGFPMRTVMEMPGAGKLTMTVLSVSEDPIADADFAVPSDYKPMSMPAGFPGAPQTP